jgi:membrane protein implicated in regulation of membrane protease activity
MAKKRTAGFFQHNGLSIVLVFFMLVFWAAQFYTGWKVHNDERKEEGQASLSAVEYASSGHFVSATFENWESEFLQMAIYVLLTIFLYQKGSAESKKPKDEEGANEEEVDREPKPHPGAPWPVKKGGWILRLYASSLSIVFAILFLLSFWLHFYGSWRDYNEEQANKGLPAETKTRYLTNNHFWFESFQNWQSEFLAVAAIVLFTVWFRQKGSPESKPVDAPNDQTGA